LTEFDEMWHDDAYCSVTADELLNLELLKIPDGGGRHLEESQKNRDIFAKV